MPGLVAQSPSRWKEEYALANPETRKRNYELEHRQETDRKRGPWSRERFTAALANRTSCITRGRGGWLDLPRGGLAPPILCQLPGALGDGSCVTSNAGPNGDAQL